MNCRFHSRTIGAVLSTLPDCEHASGCLPPGIYPASHDQLRDRFCRDAVSADAAAQTHRQLLFSGDEALVDAFNLVGLPSKQWIGGSFISARPDPNDIDLVNFCRLADYKSLAQETPAMIRQFIQDKQTAAHFHCDSYFVPVPKDEAHAEDFPVILDLWTKKLGHDKIGRPKGIVLREVAHEANEANNKEAFHATAA